MTDTTKLALIAAPLALSGYGVVRYLGRLDGRYGPGADWQFAHFLGLAGFLLFAWLILGLRSRLPAGPIREVVVATTLAGLAASVVQFGTDIVQGFLAADKPELTRLQHQFHDLPGVRPVVYDVGPVLFYVGLVAIAVLAARARLLPWWSPVVVLVALLLPPISLDLMPVTGLLTLVALLPLWPHLNRRAGTGLPSQDRTGIL